MRVMRAAMRGLAATLVLSSVVVVADASADAVPPPPPKFWTVSRCEQMLQAHDYGLLTADGHHFWVGQRTCVGTGGPRACEWTSDHQSRLYSEFDVFTGARSTIGGAVRSWTLTTRGGGHGLVRLGHGPPVGPRWPADFYMSPASVTLLAAKATPARFGSIVAPIAARLTQQENATGCTGA
jgi:hypothetical protein